MHNQARHSDGFYIAAALPFQNRACLAALRIKGAVVHQFDEILMDAAAGIGDQYFQLPVASSDDLIYRERVYCYELYHQMRVRWPEECPYSLGGEVDKAGHPLIRGNGLDGLKPDFLVHVPGDMGGNYAVMEVKPANGSPDGVAKDIETLKAFIENAGYERGLLLVYGARFDGLPGRVCKELQQAPEEIEIWIHSQPVSRAERMVEVS